MNPWRERGLERFEWALVVCLIVWFGCTSLPQAWHGLNSDFSNYYVTAHLLRDHSSVSRIYEWIWFQRQKDHIEAVRSVSVMMLITPFSTLFLTPFGSLTASTAKHCWLIVNGFILLAVAWLLRSITGLRWSRIALIAAASYPLERDLAGGQLHLLLLFFLALALRLHLRGQRFSSGMVIAVAIGLKLFPLLYVLYFLRKRDWRAIAGTLVGGVAVAAVSLAAFGWQVNRVYLTQVLPRGTQGDSAGPYVLTSSSFAVLFHRLFVFEPVQNPHPAIHAAWLLTVLLPIVQLLLVAPLVLLADPAAKDPRRIRFEWSAVLLVCLAISPVPSSYHFVLLLLPTAVLVREFIDKSAHGKLVTVILLFLAVGFPFWPTHSGGGWLPLLHVPRLYAMIALCLLMFSEMRPKRERVQALRLENMFWLTGIAGLTAVSILLALRSQPVLDAEYAGRVGVLNEPPMIAQPLPAGDGVAFVAMGRSGYRELDSDEQPDSSQEQDELSHAVFGSRRWIERGGATSRIVANDGNVIENAEQPVVSPDGHWLAFERSDQGRGVLWLRALDGSQADAPVTPPDFDMLEASFVPDGGIVFAAYGQSGVARLYERSSDGEVVQLSGEEARFPAVSPDGRWLAYSELVHGSWNLRLRDRSTGQIEQLTDASCNAVEPAWESDSHTLLFASDCGRAIRQAALYRRQVVR